jgi:hypothetical protein
LFACSKNNGGKVNPGGTDTTKKPTVSPVGDVVGKVTTGYQGWFSADGDGSPLNNWGHMNLECWPDVTDYPKTYQTEFGNLQNGQPAKMFSSYDQATVNLHFKWMQQYGIDCAALQRFSGELSNNDLKNQRDGIAQKVRTAAEASGRKFYIMYDISGHKDMQATLKEDWVNTITGKLNLLSSPAYAKQNGKPVVCIWGMGYTQQPVPGGGDPVACLDVINWFKSKGCYVIGGVPMAWRAGNNQSRGDFFSVYKAFNMISPWAVGAEVNTTYEPWIKGDNDFCVKQGIDYQPVAYPGFSFHNSNAGSRQNEIPRVHGDFMWSQVATMKRVGARSLYVAMFDELNEGTAIFKVAPSANEIPAGKWYLTLDADGVSTSSDFYLRLTGDAGKMIRGEIAYTDKHPTSHN